MSEVQNIEYYSKHVYGAKNLYIVDGDISDAVARLTGKKTINLDDIKNIEFLTGKKFKEVLEPNE